MTAMPSQRGNPAAPAGGYRLRDVTRMEWIKTRGLRSTGWALLLAVAATVAAGIVAGVNTRNPHGDPVNNILAGVVLAQVIIGVLGAATMTGEYPSGMISATLAAVPRRPLVLTAKAAVLGALTLAAGELACFAAFGAGAAFLRPGIPHPSLSQPAVLRAVALTGAYLALIGLIGLGIGAIIRHGALAVAVLIGLVFVLPAIGGLARTGAGKFLPELIAANSLSVVRPVAGYAMSPWAGLGLVACYAAVALTAGGWLLARRDA